MRRLVHVLCLLSLGCDADPAAPLGLGLAVDGGASLDTGDAEIPQDAGLDAGSTELGALDTGSGGSCGPSEPFSMRVRGIGPEGYAGTLRFVPTALVRMVDPQQLREVIFFGPLPDRLSSDLEYWAEVETVPRGRLDPDVRLTLRALGPQGPAGVTFVAWSGLALESGEVGPVAWAHRSEGCVARTDPCGTQSLGEQADLRIRGERLRLSHGERVVRPTDEAMNGGSYRYEVEPGCGDVARAHFAGWVWLAPTRGAECGALLRDACITTPGCVLWGSELSDPGYTCREAAGACEGLKDAEACAASGCEWDPGECYCPEGVVCGCGGGPAPKCRSRCGGFAQLMCPDGRYCDDADRQPPACIHPPESGGRCEWAPISCSGTPRQPVCACTGDGARTFENDCLRRQARAGAPRRGACP